MCLVQTWYGLSDYQVEERVNDSLSFSYFCGMIIEQVAPDHSTISRFRTQMTKAKAYDALLEAINVQLESHAILVKKGAIVDARVVEYPLEAKRQGYLSSARARAYTNKSTAADFKAWQSFAQALP